MGNVLKSRGILFVATFVLLSASVLHAQRKVENFNRGWCFAQGEQDEQVVQPGFDDSGWQAVQLPHDWAIAGPFNPNEDGYAGKLPWRGVGWYRKTFELAKDAEGRRVYLDFDGVMAFPKVYVNGQLAGEWDYGYMAFRVDATPYVKFGQKNVVAVQADTRRHGTRWYPGAGIYRKVEMVICDPVHIAQWGTYVTTPEVGDASATVCVRSTLDNHRDVASDVTVEVVVLDSRGRSVATGKKNVSAPAGEPAEVEQSLVVKNPRRWDVTSPVLYKVKTTVRAGGQVVDVDETPFGIRTFEFTANDGFHLNGRRVQLYGVCLHHDHGPLGAAFFPRAMERQLEIMRDMGVNAIRTSHNPPAAELLDLCDRMGFVVWDEAFDKWDGTADRINGQPPLEQYGEKQIRNLTLRDRNHPSVVCWSIGNEIGNQPSDREGKSPERVKFMSDFFRKYDPTRPVGMACHIPGTVDAPILDALDFTGWNYARRYARYREKYPDKPILYSESASTLSTRGFYELPLPDRKTEYSRQFQVDSYDLNAAQWSDIPDIEFQLMIDDSFVAGEFVWTGFDYLGEPTPFSRQARSSYFGVVDLCGIPKDRFYLYRSHWRPDTTTVHILPHWNWPDRVGEEVPVFVYTNGDSAELFLNGKSLGRRTKGAAPPQPENFAQGKSATAGSTESDKGLVASNANDGDASTRWCAATADAQQWWQVDLGQVRPIRYLAIDFEREEKNYGYEIKVSTDASDWRTVATKNTSRMPRWGGPTQMFHDVDVQARYVRIEFTQMQDGAWASIREFGVYPAKIDSPYYDVTYKYRLRWNSVVYEPGELKAVAYKGNKKIGEAVMRTAGEPATIRLTPDRTELSATGEDLSYILVEALDKNGTLCPLADNSIHFGVAGPAVIAGIGNGNPLSLEPFQAPDHKLFYGKAMLILRSVDGKTGQVRVTATSEGLKDATIRLRATR
jgi:beta-galactosidase